VEATTEISVVGTRYVSRGGYKLEAALNHFGIGVAGRRALDVGASRGGFTDCLIRRGAASVTAIEVGIGQFDPALARHPRITAHERTDIRSFAADRFPLVVVDVSFVSICGLAEALAASVEPGGDLLVLVKPQFEVGKAAVGRGVVRDPALRQQAVEGVKGCLAARGLDTVGVFASPLEGEHGNQEFFLWATNQS
jgi:23S rRNA (cytidine1920-2'-O)/16S rRNA (cytidine1409-2'-O)-methyltransferase